MSITSQELHNHLDKYLASSEKEPIVVETAEHKKSVLMSYTTYTRLISLEKRLEYEQEMLRYATPDASETLSDGAVLVREDLERVYQQMAQDEAREAEALEWAEATIGDVRDEAR